MKCFLDHISPPSASSHLLNPRQAPTMPSWDSEDRRIFVFRMPRLPELGPKRREIGIYASGALFALGWWAFIDGVTLASQNTNDPHVSIGFEDWISGILATLGMIVINLIDKSRLRTGGFSYDNGVAWKARLFLFVGFALMAGGLAGSVCVLVLKYIVKDIQMPDLYYGIAGVSQCALIMLSTVILWVAQNGEQEYQYNFIL
ncbi:hypothetical protein BC937DRAFT_95277 [Endogone sp. FLAS-F59071]|nr:hypothetical protein BC937DRAFT_95277 [Endogone sp. FLAS-F59071]|eukprot:RUS20419.1 hypothetical protein BC937DRAFT_95277 [Endogone sp. FLAS-F59071]